MTWREVSIPDVATQYEYTGRRVRVIETEEFIMHGGINTVVVYPKRYEVWED